MTWLQLIIVLAFIFLGVRLGSIGIGFAGTVGVVVLTLGFAGALWC
ncbi:anaerobic C4-dicarboxylate transporter family protein [Endozoicomonas sp. YOMI1]|nr:anaerobic C4-dicarboxylate transporter family protein [Endozoicomonas sp. YOMI1]